jgi:hypothetical protein
MRFLPELPEMSLFAPLKPFSLEDGGSEDARTSKKLIKQYHV